MLSLTGHSFQKTSIHFIVFRRMWELDVSLGTHVHLVVGFASIFHFSLLRNESKPPTLPPCCTFPFDYLGMESNSRKVRMCSLRMFYESLMKKRHFPCKFSKKITWFKD